MCNIRSGILLAVAMGFATIPAMAQQNLNISIENHQSADGFYLTPLWFGIHDGSFDFFDGGNMAAASAALELLAEEGDASALSSDFAAAQPAGQQGVILSPGGFPGAPVIDPGETAMTTISVNDPATNQFLSFASMVIPSNDAFIGNDNAMAYQLFDGLGNFNGPFTIQVFGSSIYDAGTEVNDENGGAAFSANGGLGTDEFLFVRIHPGLDNFIGTDTVAGTTIGSGIAGGELLATVTVSVPEPGSIGLLGIASVMAIARRRRR